METTLSHQKDALGQSDNQTISWNKEGTFFPRKNPTSGAWNGCGVCSSGVASQERWAVRIQGGGEERRATTLAPPPPEPAPECHTAREPGSQGNTERRAWVRHFQGLGTTTIATTDISTTMVSTIVTTKIKTNKNLDHNPDHDRHHDHHYVHHYDHRDEHA